MKNIGMKKNINEQREGIWGESLESLKSLKSLMQIFAESANSAKRIFATFATFAMQIFSNLVNMVKTVMQIFAKGEYSAVRVSSVQRPTNIQRISNLSPTVSTVNVAQKSRIRPILPLFTTMVMVILSGWNSEAWGLDEYELVLEGTENQIAQYKEDNLNKLISVEGESTKRFHVQNGHAIFEIDKIESYENTLGVKYLQYEDLSSNGSRTSYFTWSVDTSSVYVIKVSNVLLKLRAYNAISWWDNGTDSYFTDGSTSGDHVDCKTNGTGTKDVTISSSPVLSPLALIMTAASDKGRRYCFHEVKYTYSIYHKEYLFDYKNLN